MNEEEYESQIRAEYIYMLDKQQEEIERLNKQIEEYQKALDETTSEKVDLYFVIKEVREYIEKELDIEKICRQEKSLTICKKELLEILDKVGEE